MYTLILKIRIYTLLAFAILLPFIAISQVLDTKDSLALVDFYNSTNGPYWNNHTNWLTEKPVSTWYGVAVQNNRVTQLTLTGDGLNGNISSSLGNLTALTYLSLIDNHLTGAIPSSIGNLTKLSYLFLTYNNLGDSIPSSIGNLTALITLDFHNNGFTGDVPASIGNLVNLTGLNLQFNQFKSIPVSIGRLVNLTTLNLSTNQIEGAISDSLSNLLKLNVLDLEDNRLTGGIPASLGKLPLLRVLDLSFNKLSGGIPPALGDLISLQYLYLQGNRLEGSIPSSLGNIPGLNSLTLADNHLSGTIPLSIIELNQLTLSNNKFNFTDIEPIAYRQYAYAPQANIKLFRLNDQLTVSAGGTLSKNTYTWYNILGNLPTIIKGDSTFKPPISGNYFVAVTNDIATYLTLYSDTILANPVTVQMCPPIASTTLQSGIAGTTYQWQADTSGNGQFYNIADNSIYSGADTSVLQMNSVPSRFDGFRYRCIVDGSIGIVYVLEFRNIWWGVADQNWENPANWHCGTVPDSNTNVTIQSGVVYLNTNTTVKSLTIKNEAIVNIATGAHLIIHP